MPPVRALFGAVAVSLTLASSASAGGFVVRSAPHTVGVHPNRFVVAAPVGVRSEPPLFARPVDPWRFWPPGTVVTRHGASPFGSSLVFPGTIGSGVVVASTDRKSTRLNSCHTVISYAVFCLKKKKIQQENDEPHRKSE